ncbi:MAG: hypothetical protein GY928_22265 [Colwellia sp.]|nr:hypothetical protein [Colwellia sp.]
MAEFQTRKEKYAEYLKSPEWEDLRDFAKFKNRKKNNGLLKCSDCGTTEKVQYDVHHWMYPNDLKYDIPENHIVLCHRCHGIAHDKIELSEKETIERAKDQHDYMVKAMTEMLKKMDRKEKV